MATRFFFGKYNAPLQKYRQIQSKLYKMATYRNTATKKTHKPTDYLFGVFQKYFNKKKKKQKQKKKS